MEPPPPRALDDVGGRTFGYMTTANGQVLRRDEMLGGSYDAALGRVRDFKANRHHAFYNLNRLISVADPSRYEIKYAYDANGNRTWLRSGYADGIGGTKSVQEYFYKYDALNRLETTTIDGRLRSSRSYDLGGRGTDYVYGLEGTLASTKTFGDATTQTSTYTYEWWDDAKRKSTMVEASNNQYVAWNPGFTKFWYDANGNVKGALDEVGGRSFEYMTTANGQVLRRDEMLGGRYDETLGRVLDSKANRQHGFFHFDGKRIGNVGNDGIEREDYVQQMARSRDAEMSPDAKYRQYTPVAGADFDENYLPINASYPDIAPGRYTVRAGDTLRTVARILWGDGAMWYLLAQANGLQIQPEAALKEFTTLTVPNVVTNFHNTSETNRVYNAAWALGDTSPSLPAPQLPPPQSSGKCGGMGQVLMIVVAIAATVYTAGAVTVGLTQALQAGVAATMTQGAGVLSGALLSASPGLSLAASAAGGAAGSVASQAVGIATGRQQDFSWRQVAMSAVGSMVSSSIGPGAIGANPLDMSPYQAAAARAAFTSTSLQAVSMASGQQGRFSWRAVAASAVGAGLGQGAQVGFGAQAAPSALSRALGETFGEVGRGTVFGMMSGATASAIGSGRVMARQVAVDAFGNALGNSLVAAASGDLWPQAREATISANLDREDQDLGKAMRSNAADAQRRAYSDQAFNALRNSLSANPTASANSNATLIAAANGVTDLGQESSSDLGGGLKIDPSRLPRFWTSETFEYRYAPSLGLKEVGDYFSGFGSGFNDRFSLSGVVEGVSGFVSGLVTDFGGTLESSGLAMQDRVRQLFKAGRSGDFTTAGRIEGGIAGEQAAGLVLGVGVGQGLRLGATAFNAVGGVASDLVASSLAPYASIRLGATGLADSVGGVGPVWMSSLDIRQSQKSISFQKFDKDGNPTHNLYDISRGFAENPSDPRLIIDVVRMRDGGLISVDNSRPAVLNAQGGGQIQVRLRSIDEPLIQADIDRFTAKRSGGEIRTPSTWGEAIDYRIWSQGNQFMTRYPNGMGLVPKITNAPAGSIWSQFNQLPWGRR